MISILQGACRWFDPYVEEPPDDDWPFSYYLENYAQWAPLEGAFDHAAAQDCTAPPAAEVFDSAYFWQPIDLYALAEPVFAHPLLRADETRFVIVIDDTPEPSFPEPALYWATRLSDDTVLRCGGESAAGAVILIEEVPVERYKNEATPEEIRDQMSAAVEEHGLEEATDGDIASRCDPCHEGDTCGDCVDFIPPPAA